MAANISRVAILAPEPIRPRMAGMGIRALELARALAPRFDVRLLVPNDPGEAREVAGGLTVEAAPSDRLRQAARGAEAAVVSGHAASWWFHQVPEVPVAADLYDPFPIENLHYARSLGAETARHDRAALALALARADFFLCASPEQRLFYAGALFASGRIDARNFPDDSSLSTLLAIAPFGVPEEAARGDRAAGRRAAGVPDSGPLVLFGGVYDWYDPELLLGAWPAIRQRRPDARLLFFENPNPDTTPQSVFQRTRQRAQSIDPEGGSIVFSAWLPYAAREDLYAATDLIVSISSEGLETDLSYRTRLLDAAWGGVPSVTVHGGSLAVELARAGAGFPCGRDAAALAERVETLLSDAGAAALTQASRAARRFASERTWRAVAAPLEAWCHSARVDPGRRPAPREIPKGSRLSRLFQ